MLLPRRCRHTHIAVATCGEKGKARRCQRERGREREREPRAEMEKGAETAGAPGFSATGTHHATISFAAVATGSPLKDRLGDQRRGGGVNGSR
jgi:hypothetical protein